MSVKMILRGLKVDFPETGFFFSKTASAKLEIMAFPGTNVRALESSGIIPILQYMYSAEFFSSLTPFRRQHLLFITASRILTFLQKLIPEGELKTALLAALPYARRLNVDLNERDYIAYPISGSLKELGKCSAKEIRIGRANTEQICIFKIGIVLTPTESKTWLHTLKKLTSVKHKSTLLRVAHGEIYCKERMFRFGLVDDPRCDHCGETETIEHKLFTCGRISSLWIELNRITNSMINILDPGVDEISRNLGAFLNTNKIVLTVNAELIGNLMGNLQGDPQPRTFIKNMLKNIARKEGNTATGSDILQLIQENY